MTDQIVDLTRLIRRVENVERAVRELGPSVAASFAGTVSTLQSTVDDLSHRVTYSSPIIETQGMSWTQSDPVPDDIWFDSSALTFTLTEPRAVAIIAQMSIFTVIDPLAANTSEVDAQLNGIMKVSVSGGDTTPGTPVGTSFRQDVIGTNVTIGADMDLRANGVSVAMLIQNLDAGDHTVTLGLSVQNSASADSSGTFSLSTNFHNTYVQVGAPTA